MKTRQRSVFSNQSPADDHVVPAGFADPGGTCCHHSADQSQAIVQERIFDEFLTSVDTQSAAIDSWLGERVDNVVTLSQLSASVDGPGGCAERA